MVGGSSPFVPFAAVTVPTVVATATVGKEGLEEEEQDQEGTESHSQDTEGANLRLDSPPPEK